MVGYNVYEALFLNCEIHEPWARSLGKSKYGHLRHSGNLLPLVMRRLLTILHYYFENYKVNGHFSK